MVLVYPYLTVELYFKAILKAIDKGDIVNSGVHQATKDGSVGKGNCHSLRNGLLILF
jgi:hypothetical protein